MPRLGVSEVWLEQARDADQRNCVTLASMIVPIAR